ncbi:MAG: hypothetical protein V8S95_03520 [Odoribacter sp.]
MKAFLKGNPEIAGNLEAEIRKNAVKLMTPQAKWRAKAAGRAGSVSAKDLTMNNRPFESGVSIENNKNHAV